MEKQSLNKEETEIELRKYLELNLAAIDYRIELVKKEELNPQKLQRNNEIITIPYDSIIGDLEKIKVKIIEVFEKGSLSKLKQYFKNAIEMPLEAKDLSFNGFIKKKTGIEIDIFESFNNRIEKIIEKGKITTDNQFYDVNILVNELCQQTPVNSDKVKVLNTLLLNYEEAKSKKK